MPSRSVRVVWEGPLQLADVLGKADSMKDCGLYQIYGRHLLYRDRPRMLLYIGKTDRQTFKKRFEQHTKWLKHEIDVSIVLGRIHDDDHDDVGPPWPNWTRLVGAVEAALIYWSSPPYNSHAIRGYGGPSLRILNLAARGDLPAELSTENGPIATAGPEEVAFEWVGRITIGSVPHGSEGGAEKWKPVGRDEARPQLERLGVALPVKRPVKLVVCFWCTKTQKAFDIDNALKNVIDALGAAGLFGPSKGGGAKGEWNTEDELVWAVDARKMFSSDDAPSTTVDILLAAAGTQ